MHLFSCLVAFEVAVFLGICGSVVDICDNSVIFVF